MVTIRLGGVPEQVNIPIQICFERQIFAKYGCEVEWKEIKEGTGRMVELLEKDEVDVALTVTDAFISAKAKGRRISLYGTYCKSPLVWAVASSHSEQKYDDTFWTKTPLRFGISRMGSGSHTMAYYAAKNHNVKQENLNFIVANNIDGLVDGVRSNAFDCFMWETFTTNPYFLSKELSKVDDVPTPWPAFSFVGQSNASEEIALSIKNKLFPALKEGIDIFLSETVPGGNDASLKTIVEKFGHSQENAQLWLSRVKYAESASMETDLKILNNSVETLKELNLVPQEFETQSLWSTDDPSKSNGVITVDRNT